jgi:photosystem II stability/assembly factor-like uncharacterized protein
LYVGYNGKLLRAPLRTFVVLLVFTAILTAQSPVRVEYACPAEDVESFGLACSADDPCPVFLELAWVESAGARLLATGNLHTATTTLYGILLLSEDAGKIWTEPIMRLRSAALDQIQFIDLQTGWISGQQIEPLPKDSFLLLTTDGGKTWRHRPLFDETRVGSIAQFWFESRTIGELVFDRSQGTSVLQELYQTMTGGESWAPARVSRTVIRLQKAQPRDSASWRARADAATKTYRIERRAGDKWESVASFLIEIGDCK